MKKLLTTETRIVAILLVVLGGGGWIARSWAAEGEDDTTTTVFRVEGMTCGGCEAGVKIAVTKLDGVASVDASYEKGTATVTYDPEQVTREEIVAAIEKLGYKAEVAEAPGSKDGPGS